MEKIATVIVTYNRLELLKECIIAVKNQSLTPSAIIVVNNDSNDGTFEWLNSQISDTFIPIHQENLGGAGGFHNGMKYAMDNGFDWVWLMDDDGYPETDALKNLYEEYLKDNAKKILNSIVVLKENPNMFSFVTRIYKDVSFNMLEGLMLFRTLTDIPEKYKSDSMPTMSGFFNSSLLHSSVIQKVGLPYSELFIRGDEFEYSLRVQSAGFHKFLCYNSVHYHPVGDSNVIKIFGRIIPLEVKNAFKLYYHVRNSIFINKKYKLNLGNIACRNFLKELLVFIFYKRSLNDFITNIKIIFKAKKDSKILNERLLN